MKTRLIHARLKKERMLHEPQCEMLNKELTAKFGGLIGKMVQQYKDWS